jgi:hypothetical protein
MKVRKNRWIFWLPPGLLAAALLLAGTFLFRPDSSGFSAPLQQAGLPSEGWRVCADLGIGQPPGAPGNVQLLLMCAGDDWEVRAYCLEPAKPAPPLNTGCSLQNGSVFWCGDGVQLMQLYQIQQTPAPTATPIPATATPLPSATPLPTSTSIPAPTSTALPTSVQPTTPPQPGGTPAPGIVPTVFVRPNAGGPGNLLPALALLSGISGLGILLGMRFSTRRK